MKIKLVRMKSDGAVSVAMLQEDRWIPLKPLLVDLRCAGIDNAEKICTDILSVWIRYTEADRRVTS